jgi:hypothetical protein
MPKVKVYDRYTVPDGVAKIVKAVCADYDRRRRALAGELPEDVRTRLVDLNNIVDQALAVVDEPCVRADILRDMVARRGYEHSHAQMYLCENSYYARRRLVVYEVAKQLHLV